MTWATGAAGAAVMVFACLCGGGCGGGTGPRADGGALRLDLYVHDYADVMAVRYTIKGDDVLNFGGGKNARSNAPTWSGPLSAEQRRGLEALLVQHAWLETDPVGTGEPKSLKHEVQVRWRGERNSFRATGACAAIDPVRAYLEGIAQHRYDAFIERLPKPDIEELVPAREEPGPGP